MTDLSILFEISELNQAPSRLLFSLHSGIQKSASFSACDRASVVGWPQPAAKHYTATCLLPTPMGMGDWMGRI